MGHLTLHVCLVLSPSASLRQSCRCDEKPTSRAAYGGISILVTGSERHSYDAREGSTYAWRYLFQRLSASKDDEMTTFISKFRL
jgi:hypothetical protein